MVETSILYVEDNPENRLLVKRTLEAAGYSVLEATDGPSGLRVAERSRPDLILLDISLPQIDGYDLARRFADFPHLERVPVLAVTANVMKGDRERALGAGCDGYIPKPINIDDLPGQIEEALRKARAGDGGTAAERKPVSEELVEEARPEPEGLETELPAELDLSDIFGVEEPGELAAVEADRIAAAAELEAERAEDDDLLIELLAELEAESPGQVEDGEEEGEAVAAGELEVQEVSTAETGAERAVEPPEEIAEEDVSETPVEEAGDAAEAELEEEEPAAVAVEEEAAPHLEEPGEAAADEVPVLRLGEESKAALQEAMQSLADEVGAEAVLLMQGDAVLQSVGPMTASRMERLAASAAEVFQSSRGVASALGCEDGCREQITSTGDFLLHTVALEADAVMLTAMLTSVPLGAARLWVKRSAARVDDVLRDQA